jgi:hypothetical protein
VVVDAVAAEEAAESVTDVPSVVEDLFSMETQKILIISPFGFTAAGVALSVKIFGRGELQIREVR